MATTRLIPLHIRKSKNLAKSLIERVDYAENGQKTNNGELITSYECAPKACAQEFMLSKREYAKIHGTERKTNVIAYQIRQAFKPGEVTPEEANQIGYETAQRWLKGNHAFIVATHIDRAHIHNHIIYNSTTLDCERKWQNFFLSSMALQKVSDLVCIEHGVSIVTPRAYRDRPKYDKSTYYQNDRNRRNSDNVDSASGTFRDFALILDIQKIIEKNKGPNYERWAKRYNLKQTAKALCYIKEQGIDSISELIRLTDNKTKCSKTMSDSLREKQNRLDEINELKKHIVNYAKSIDTYKAYMKSGYSKKFYEDNREAIELNKAARNFFTSHQIKKVPKMQTLREEFTRILSEKKKEYAEYKELKASMQDLLIARHNLEAIINSDGKEEKSHEIQTVESYRE